MTASSIASADEGARSLTVREVSVRYGRAVAAPKSITDPEHVAAFFRARIGRGQPQEHFCALYLDARHRAIGWRVVSIGTATASLVHPREVFQAAVALGACAIIIAHNHPSGDPTPSPEDREVTGRLERAGTVLGIALLDHVVVTDRGYESLRQRGEMLPR